MDPLDPFPMFNGHVQWIQWMSNGSICVDPMEINKPSLANEHQFGGHCQWCLMDPMDTMDPLDSMDPLDKNTKLMFTRRTRFGDCVHWIHSDGSIGHPLDPLDNRWIHWTMEMSIEYRKWINGSIGSIKHHWTTLPMDIMSNGCPLDMMDPMNPLDYIHNSCDPFTLLSNA